MKLDFYEIARHAMARDRTGRVAGDDETMKEATRSWLSKYAIGRQRAPTTRPPST